MIHEPWHSLFGDQWGTINMMAHRAAATGRPVRLHSPPHLRRLHLEIIDVPQLPFESCIELTDEPWTVQTNGFDVWATPFCPTKDSWSFADQHPYVTYQIDGVSSAQDKNPDAQDAELLLGMLYRSGFAPVRLGAHLSVAQCVQAVVESVFFVGVDSGMSHLCHSVGVPMFLLEYKLPVVTTHRGKAYIQCQGVGDLLRWKLPTWIDYLRAVGHPDGEQSTIPRGRKEREAAGPEWWKTTTLMKES